MNKQIGIFLAVFICCLTSACACCNNDSAITSISYSTAFTTDTNIDILPQTSTSYDAFDSDNITNSYKPKSSNTDNKDITNENTDFSFQFPSNQELLDFVDREFTGVSNEEYVAFLASVHSISICYSNSMSESDIEFLGHFKELEITLSECGDISFLGDLDNLEALIINNGETLPSDVPPAASYFESYDFLGTMDNLCRLNVNGAVDFPLSSICDNSSINAIHFYACSFDKNTAINESITELSIHSCDFNLDNIHCFPNLTKLEISGIAVDLSPIGSLKHLTDLYLYSTGLNGVEYIGNCTELRNLEIYSRHGSYPDILTDVSFVFNLNELNELALYSGMITDEQRSSICLYLPKCIIKEYDVP